MIKTLNNKFYVKNSIGKIRTSFNIDRNVLNNHINLSVSDRLVDKNPATDRDVYTTRDPYFNGIGNFVRNSSCWLNGISNISCFSPAQLSGANWWQRAGTLISPRHVLFVTHFTPSILPNGGTPIIFVDDNNNVVRRNIIKYESNSTADMAVGLLNSDMPSNIKVAKVLPQNYATYINITSANSGRTLMVALDQEQKALVKEAAGVTTVTFSPGVIRRFLNIPNLESDHPWYSFTEIVVAGDSGQPLFYIIDNELVLLSVWSTATTGPAIPEYYHFLNSVMQNLGGGYQLTPIDLQSVYDKYR